MWSQLLLPLYVGSITTITVCGVNYYNHCMWGQLLQPLYVGSITTTTVCEVNYYNHCMWGQLLLPLYVGSITTTVCEVNYYYHCLWGQLLTTYRNATEVAYQCFQWATNSCSRPQPATNNGVRGRWSNWLAVTPHSLQYSNPWAPFAQISVHCTVTRMRTWWLLNTNTPHCICAEHGINNAIHRSQLTLVVNTNIKNTNK